MIYTRPHRLICVYNCSSQKSWLFPVISNIFVCCLQCTKQESTGDAPVFIQNHKSRCVAQQGRPGPEQKRGFSSQLMCRAHEPKNAREKPREAHEQRLARSKILRLFLSNFGWVRFEAGAQRAHKNHRNPTFNLHQARLRAPDQPHRWWSWPSLSTCACRFLNAKAPPLPLPALLHIMKAR